MTEAAAKVEKAKLTLPDGREHEMTCYRSTIGKDICLIDIRDLYSKVNAFTYDPGFTCTASCASAITYLDGDKGICLYRGYAVADLCRHYDYTDVCHLLLNGDLPTEAERVDFVNMIEDHMMVHERFKEFFKVFRMNAHPMAIMVSASAALSSFYSESMEWSNEEHRESSAINLVAKMPTLAAMAYKSSIGEPIVYPRAGLSYAANFLRMMFATPMKEYVPNPVHVRAIDRFLTIHADHEQNASTSTVRIAGSSQANPFACVAAGIACLWGPAHGGANEAVLKMLADIGTVENIQQFVTDVKNKKDGVRLMGFGHRVYKTYDPRAVYMRELCKEVFDGLEYYDPQLAIAQELEKIALSDEYFKKRNLYPNVDFYSGLILRAIGIPTSMFTVMFALGRSLGWITHWMEMVGSGQMRIGRPRQLYQGVVERTVPAPAPLPTAMPSSRDISRPTTADEPARKVSSATAGITRRMSGIRLASKKSADMTGMHPTVPT